MKRIENKRRSKIFEEGGRRAGKTIRAEREIWYTAGLTNGRDANDLLVWLRRSTQETT